MTTKTKIIIALQIAVLIALAFFGEWKTALALFALAGLEFMDSRQ